MSLAVDKPGTGEKVRAVKAAMHRLAREMDERNRFGPNSRAEREIECLEAVVEDLRKPRGRR